MRIFVVYGSKSDEAVSAGPLVKALEARGFDVTYEVISAHRNLEQLQDTIPRWTGDAIIAGAGLAAALPGVVAAMTLLPVFGVPVPSQFGGMDSLCSIAQMPPGVPVITCGPGHEKDIVTFLEAYRTWQKAAKIHFVAPDAAVLQQPDFVTELEKAAKAGHDSGIAVSASTAVDDGAFNAFLVTKAADIRPDAFGLHVPLLPKDAINTPAAYLPVMEWACHGGLWVGVNNARNAVQSVVRLAGAQTAVEKKRSAQ